MSAYLTQGLHRNLQHKPGHLATRYCGRQTTFGELGDRVARLGQSTSPPDGVSLLLTPFFHVAGLGRLIIQVIMGQSSVILPRFDPELVLRAIQEDGVDEVGMVPSMLQMVLDHPSFGQYELSGLKRVGYGASPMTLALLERVMAALPGVEFTHSYGMTETAAVVTVSGPENHTAWGREKGLVRSAGRAGYSSEIRILDSEGREVPPGTVGEIVIRGPSIMQGYWNKPAETEAALRDGWLHTGDGGYLDAEGYLFIVDRIKDMIITGGENVYSAEVESVLARHPAVRECAVIGIPHEQWGEAVHAIVTTHPGHTVDAQALREHCRQFLAGYKCPKTVEVRESLPMSAAGKILKQVLRREHGQGTAGAQEKAAAG